MTALRPEEYPYTLFVNPGKRDIPIQALRDCDREDLCRVFIIYGLEPVTGVADRVRIVVFFEAAEVKQFENIYLTNKNIQVSLQRVIYATEWWRNLMTLHKSLVRQTDFTIHA